jgi:hypothetical protein
MKNIEQLEFAAKIINEMITYLRENPTNSNSTLLERKISQLREVNIEIVLSEKVEDNNTNN